MSLDLYAEVERAKAHDKIKIIADCLRAYLNDWRTKTNNLNCFYYLSEEQLKVYDAFLNDEDLSEEEQNKINEALNFKEVSFGEHKHKFI